jgi:hypothetical protein
MDWFTLFGVPFARPPQRVPLGGLGGIAGPEGVGAASEPDGAIAAEAKSDRHWTLDVIPLFRHYFSQKASWRLERIRFLSRFNRLFFHQELTSRMHLAKDHPTQRRKVDQSVV